MDMMILKTNADTLSAELQWLAQIIDIRMKLYWSQPCEYTEIWELSPPSLVDNSSTYADIMLHYHFGPAERVVLLLALAPHVQPHLLDVFFTKNADYDRNFTEFGGIKGQNHGGFLPTGETAAFILAANDFEQRFRLLNIFSDDHPFRRFDILRLNSGQADEPFLSGALSLSPEYLSYFTVGVSHKPDFNINFPAKHLTSQAEWNDLILEDSTIEEVLEIRDWIKHGDTMLNDWGLKKHIKPGYRTLFYGPPGTGKTLTASLLGKTTGLDVYRIDLSMVVSKYIGETEKNLSNVFDQAEHKNWILFFDEADALFGKRTQTSSSNDRYANQEVSYLLQRIEDFPGVVILATNLKANLDDAFSRRFQSMIYFPMPGFDHRKKLWQGAFSDKCVLEPAIDLDEISRKYELAGGAIINVLRYCSLMALKRDSSTILKKDLLAGIRKEFAKDGKTVS
ncbi:MAG: ATP-binding protein [Bacteroidota bacterium]|nr:ATP-binding protein [Bacteroidota bacterium]